MEIQPSEDKTSMDPLKSFPFGVILRNFLAGAFFLAGIVLVVGIPSELKSLKDISAGVVSIAVIFSLASGTAVYAIHRAIVIPILEGLYFNTKPRPGKEELQCVNENAVEMMLTRWEWGADVEKPSEIAKKYSEGLTTWADYIHFKFSSGWCLLTGVLFGISIQRDYEYIFAGIAFVLLIVAGIISDKYRHYVEDKCRDRMEKYRAAAKTASKNETDVRNDASPKY